MSISKLGLAIGGAVTSAGLALWIWGISHSPARDAAVTKTVKLASEVKKKDLPEPVESVAPSIEQAPVQVAPSTSLAPEASATAAAPPKDVQAEALAAISRRLQALQNSSNPDLKELSAALDDLEVASGSSSLGGLDISALRSTIRLVMKIQETQAEINQLNEPGKKLSAADHAAIKAKYDQLAGLGKELSELPNVSQKPAAGLQQQSAVEAPRMDASDGKGSATRANGTGATTREARP